MRKIILLSILIIYAISFNSWARKPAIEPQMEIINEFKPLPPNMAKGYSFKENVGRTPSALSSEHQTTSVAITSIITLLILGIPLSLWGAIAWKSRQLNPTNIVPFKTKQNDKSKKWEKAS